MAEKRARPDLIAARFGAQQHGVVSIQQLHRAGLSDDGVLGRVRAGRLHRVHRGVFALGHAALSREGRWMAAVLACGEKAVLSHRAAACLWGLLPLANGPVDVSLPSYTGRRRRRGIRVHRCQSLTPGCVTRHRGIPVTTVARTIADLRSEVSPSELRRIVRAAEVRGLRTGLEVGEPVRSELEHLFLELCRRHGIPLPEVNVRVGRRVVDFLWRDRRLVVETDGYRYHRGWVAFEDDHERALELRMSGYDVVQFSYRQVTKNPAWVVEIVRRELSAPTRSPRREPAP